MTDAAGWIVVAALFAGLPLWSISAHLGSVAKDFAKLREMATRNRQ